MESTENQAGKPLCLCFLPSSPCGGWPDCPFPACRALCCAPPGPAVWAWLTLRPALGSTLALAGCSGRLGCVFHLIFAHTCTPREAGLPRPAHSSPGSPSALPVPFTQSALAFEGLPPRLAGEGCPERRLPLGGSTGLPVCGCEALLKGPTSVPA